MIKTWQQRCEEHPDHEGIVTEQMIRDRMQEEIDELRQALVQPEQEPVVPPDVSNVVLTAVLAEREACAKVCDDLAANDKLSNYYAVAARAIRARGVDLAKVGEVGVWGEKPWVKTYCGGKPNYCTPVDAVNMSQECVDETAKGEHEPECVAVIGNWGKVEWKEGVFPQLGDKLYTAPPKREWVGLTRRELDIATLNLGDLEDCYIAIEAKLKEKNA